MGVGGGLRLLVLLAVLAGGALAEQASSASFTTADGASTVKACDNTDHGKRPTPSTATTDGASTAGMSEGTSHAQAEAASTDAASKTAAFVIADEVGCNVQASISDLVPTATCRISVAGLESMPTSVALFCGTDPFQYNATCCEPVVASVDLAGLCHVASQQQVIRARLSPSCVLELCTDCGGQPTDDLSPYCAHRGTKALLPPVTNEMRAILPLFLTSLCITANMIAYRSLGGVAMRSCKQ